MAIGISIKDTMENRQINRRQLLKTAAQTGLAAAIVSGISPVTAAGDSKPAETKKTLFAFFEVDCRHPDPGNSKFIRAEMTAPIGETLKNIYAKAEQSGSPILSLTCLSILRHNPFLSIKDTIGKEHSKTVNKSDAAFVSLNASPKEIEQAILCRQIFLERQAYKNGHENVQQGATNVFLHNANAVRIVQGLGERHWLVFGRGFKYCVVPTVAGLLALKKQVTVLEDATMAAHCMQTENDMTSEDFKKNVKYLKSLGAQFARFNSIWQEI
jgi:hypothetical protein